VLNRPPLSSANTDYSDTTLTMRSAATRGWQRRRIHYKDNSSAVSAVCGVCVTRRRVSDKDEKRREVNYIRKATMRLRRFLPFPTVSPPSSFLTHHNTTQHITTQHITTHIVELLGVMVGDVVILLNDSLFSDWDAFGHDTA
jgi:hypothetical protein